MESDTVLYALSGPICTITINRPHALNALNNETITALDLAMKRFARDTEAKVAILTGAGEKAFIAGADISEMHGLKGEEALLFAKKGQALTLYMESIPKPIIAVVPGYALGGGLEFALACDFILASEKARFGLPEVSLGLLPGFGGTQRLARVIGPNVARQLIFSAGQINAERAYQLGLVSEIFPHDELMEGAKKLAGSISERGPLAVASAKRALNQGLDLPLPEGLALEASHFQKLFDSHDVKEGMSAFVEKRKPQFQGQ